MARIVSRQIDADRKVAQLGFGFVNHTLNIAFDREICLEDKRPPSLWVDRIQELLGLVLGAAIDNSQVYTLGREALGHAGADPLGSDNDRPSAI